MLYAKESNSSGLVIPFHQFVQYHSTAAVIATESISSFLGQTKDILEGLKKVFSSKTEEDFVRQTLSDRHYMLSIARNTPLSKVRNEIISKPESFSGVYVHYVNDLRDASAATASLFEELAPLVKTAVANFINEYSDKKTDHIYGYIRVKAGEKELDKMVKLIGSYFKLPANKVKTTPSEVIASSTDVNKLFDVLTDISETSINPEKFELIKKEVASISELVDALIQHNIDSNVLNKNNEAKRELIECLSILGKVSEFYASLYGRMIHMCTAFNDLKRVFKQNAV